MLIVKGKREYWTCNQAQTAEEVYGPEVEVWKSVYDYPMRCEVSSLGGFRSFGGGLCASTESRNIREHTAYDRDDVPHKVDVAYQVAKAFVPLCRKPGKTYSVGFKDGSSSNLEASNLEWKEEE